MLFHASQIETKLYTKMTTGKQFNLQQVRSFGVKERLFAPEGRTRDKLESV